VDPAVDAEHHAHQIRPEELDLGGGLSSDPAVPVDVAGALEVLEVLRGEGLVEQPLETG
jgi:hypothetical protein